MKNKQQTKTLKKNKPISDADKVESNFISVANKVSIDQKIYSYIKEVNKELNINLNKIALIDGSRSFSYGQMYKEWERYAKAFNGLNINADNKSRVLIFGSMALETSLAFYGLNMVGVEVSIIPSINMLNLEKIISTIKYENISDVILTDTLLREKVLKGLLDRKEELGLKNILLMNVPTKSVAVPVIISSFFDRKASLFKNKYRNLYLEVYLWKYRNSSLELEENLSKEGSVILHTSGTTSGSGKPIVLSDSANNAKCRSIMKLEGYDFLKEDLRSVITVDLSNGYGLTNQLNPFLAVGGTILFVPFGVLNPFLPLAVKPYKINVLFTVSPAVEGWPLMPYNQMVDLSLLKALVVGGSKFSNADRLKFEQYFKTVKGKDIIVINGYGLTELGGACTLSLPDSCDDSIGYVTPGVEIKIMDEDSGKFISKKDLPKSGILYINSDAATSGILDNKQIVEFSTIKAKKYLCTNDVVSMEKDGKLTYICRANRFYVNNGKISYNADKALKMIGEVDKSLNNPLIISYFNKNVHDTIPMLCIEKGEDSTKTIDSVKRTLNKIFLKDNLLPEDQIPRVLFVCEKYVRNTNGKIDIAKLKNNQVKGERFKIDISDKKVVLEPLKEDENYLYDYTKGIIDDIVNGLIKDFIPKSWLENKDNIISDIINIISSGNDDISDLEKFKTNSAQLLQKASFLNSRMFDTINGYMNSYRQYMNRQYNYYQNLNEMFQSERNK